MGISESRAAVAVDRVTVRRGGAHLLEATSFTLARGEALSLTGANGSGKTTLLRLLAGLEKPSDGDMRVDGRPVDERDPAFRGVLAAHVGSVPFSMTLTLREHLRVVASSWPPRSRGVTAGAAGAAGQDPDGILERLRLTSLSDRFPHELSSGQLQLASLATVLTRPFAVLLLDEPEQRLDPERLVLIVEVLQAEVRRGAALLVATHSREIVDGLGGGELRLGGDGRAAA